MTTLAGGVHHVWLTDGALQRSGALGVSHADGRRARSIGRASPRSGARWRAWASSTFRRTRRKRADGASDCIGPFKGAWSTSSGWPGLHDRGGERVSPRRLPAAAQRDVQPGAARSRHGVRGAGTRRPRADSVSRRSTCRHRRQYRRLGGPPSATGETRWSAQLCGPPRDGPPPPQRGYSIWRGPRRLGRYPATAGRGDARTATAPMEADGVADAKSAPTAPWKTPKTRFPQLPQASMP